MKTALSWLAVGLGILVSIDQLAVIGVYGISIDGPLPNRLLGLSTVLSAIVPLSGSLVALRNRRRAAYLLLAPAPLVALCQGYADIFYSYYVDRTTLLLRDGLTVAPFLALGVFWLVTHRLRWSRLLSGLPKSTKGRLATISVGCFLLFTLVIGAALAIAAHTPPFGDCGAPRPFAKQQRPNQAAFTARIMEIPILGPVGVVRENFWGLRSWESTLVLLQAGPWFRTGDMWFIDGYRQDGLLGRSLPAFSLHCTRSAQVSDAELDLRLLRDGPPKDGVRVIGRAVRFRHDFSEQGVPGVEITITGPLGNITAATDAQGIYDRIGLPPGQYTFRSENYTEIPAVAEPQNLETGDIGGRTLVLK
jgi:hypothetical protein